jgi:hypothetical protein
VYHSMDSSVQYQSNDYKKLKDLFQNAMYVINQLTICIIPIDKNMSVSICSRDRVESSDRIGSNGVDGIGTFTFSDIPIDIKYIICVGKRKWTTYGMKGKIISREYHHSLDQVFDSVYSKRTEDRFKGG